MKIERSDSEFRPIASPLLAGLDKIRCLPLSTLMATATAETGTAGMAGMAGMERGTSVNQRHVGMGIRFSELKFGAKVSSVDTRQITSCH